jgi:hypothetical protein
MDAIQKTAIKETAKVVAYITGLVFAVVAVIALLSVQAIAALALVYLLGMAIKLIYDNQVILAREKQAKIDAEVDRLHK